VGLKLLIKMIVGCVLKQLGESPFTACIEYLTIGFNKLYIRLK